MMKTTKTIKSQKRDKPRHSGSEQSGNLKKGGAGAKGAWGKPGDELAYDYVLDENDPNYDPSEYSPDVVFTPKEEARAQFQATIEEYNVFKRGAKAAAKEFMVAQDNDEFMKRIKEMDLPIYFQDLVYITIKLSLDKKESARHAVSNLIYRMWKDEFLSSAQITSSFNKLYDSLDDIILDFPTAKPVIGELLHHAMDNNYVSKVDGASLLEANVLLADSASVQKKKKQLSVIVTEYFDSADVDDATKSLQELESPYIYFELIKKLVSTSLDKSDVERELAVVLIAHLSGGEVPQSAVAKALNILLGRVEDIYLDVPNVLNLLSRFLARLVSDEALPPSFLIRADLGGQDMGYQVIMQAQYWLDQPQASEMLADVFGAEYRRHDRRVSNAPL